MKYMILNHHESCICTDRVGGNWKNNRKKNNTRILPTEVTKKITIMTFQKTNLRKYI